MTNTMNTTRRRTRVGAEEHWFSNAVREYMENYTNPQGK